MGDPGSDVEIAHQLAFVVVKIPVDSEGRAVVEEQEVGLETVVELVTGQHQVHMMETDLDVIVGQYQVVGVSEKDVAAAVVVVEAVVLLMREKTEDQKSFVEGQMKAELVEEACQKMSQALKACPLEIVMQMMVKNLMLVFCQRSCLKLNH